MNNTPSEHDDLKTAITMLGGQKAVANRFGIPYRTVQNWYRGERTPPEYVARLIIMYNLNEWDNDDIIFNLERENEHLKELAKIREQEIKTLEMTINVLHQRLKLYEE